MFKPGLPRSVLTAVAWMSISAGCRSAHQSEPVRKTEENPNVAVHYVEIVSPERDTLISLYEHMYRLSFGPEDPDLGQARVATRADGALVGIRKPLAAHEHPTIRTYFTVEDIQRAVQAAAKNGATIAYPPTQQGRRGTFAIVIQGGVEHGLWQR